MGAWDVLTVEIFLPLESYPLDKRVVLIYIITITLTIHDS